MAKCCSSWWHALIYLTISITLAAIAITTTTHHSTTPDSQINHHISSNASRALRSHGFHVIATLLQISPELFLSAPQTTIFAVQDHTVFNSSFPPWALKKLLQYHTSPCNLTFKNLLDKKQGTCLSTLVPSKNIQITKINPSSNSIEINNVLISHPDLFLEGPISIHGVSGFFSSLNLTVLDQDVDFIESPVCGTNHAVASKITRPNNVIEWGRIVRLLSSNGFVSFAIGLHSILDEIIQKHSNLSCVTIFAPPNLVFVTSSKSLLYRTVRYHIVSKRISFSELSLLSKKTPLKTLVTRKNLHVTSSFNETKMVAIDGVIITKPNIISSKRFVVHGISRAFHVKEDHSHVS